MTRTHYQVDDDDGPLLRAACGWLNGDATRLTRDPLHVDCALCMRHIANRAQSGSLEMPDAAERYTEQIFRPGPATEYDGARIAERDARTRANRRPCLNSYAVRCEELWDPELPQAERHAIVEANRVAADVWRRYRDGCACGHCVACSHETTRLLAMARDPWRKRHAVHDESRPRWSSVGQALEVYVGHKLDGYPAKAWGGTYETIRTLGSFVQASGGERGFSAAQRAAHDVVAVDAALRSAFDDDYLDHGLSNATCLGVVLARVVGTLERTSEAGRIVQRYVPIHAADVAETLGITQDLVREVTRAGVVAIHESLERRGLVPVRRRTV